MSRPSSLERLKELERSARSRSRRIPDDWGNDDYSYSAPRYSRDINTLGPQEDVVERRRVHRQRVNIAHTHASGSNMLAENVIMLLFLVGSIYGLYKLIIYLLTQS